MPSREEEALRRGSVKSGLGPSSPAAARAENVAHLAVFKPRAAVPLRARNCDDGRYSPKTNAPIFHSVRIFGDGRRSLWKATFGRRQHAIGTAAQTYKYHGPLRPPIAVAGGVCGAVAGGNPWRATTLEWQTPQTPPGHGNWGPERPVVYRWAYAYSVPGAPEDYLPQTAPPIAGECAL